MEESRSVTPWVNRLYFESPHASSFLGLRLVKARHKNLVPLFSGVKPDPMVGSGRYAEPIPVKSPLPQCDSDCSPCRPLVPEWNNTKIYVMQTWLWIMNIFFCNSHIDAIRLGLACFTTLIGSLVNTATPVNVDANLERETVSVSFDWLPSISRKRHENESKTLKT